jgi:hypothetical protein
VKTLARSGSGNQLCLWCYPSPRHSAYPFTSRIALLVSLQRGFDQLYQDAIELSGAVTPADAAANPQEHLGKAQRLLLTSAGIDVEAGAREAQQLELKVGLIAVSVPRLHVPVLSRRASGFIRFAVGIPTFRRRCVGRVVD